MRLTWKLSGKAILPLIVLGVIAFAAWSWISRPRLPEPFTELPSIRLASVQAVSEIPAAVVDCFPELTSLLEDENEDVRRAARAALQAHAPDWPHRINLQPVDAGLHSD